MCILCAYQNHELYARSPKKCRVCEWARAPPPPQNSWHRINALAIALIKGNKTRALYLSFSRFPEGNFFLSDASVVQSASHLRYYTCCSTRILLTHIIIIYALLLITNCIRILITSFAISYAAVLSRACENNQNWMVFLLYMCIFSCVLSVSRICRPIYIRRVRRSHVECFARARLCFNSARKSCFQFAHVLVFFFFRHHCL